MPILAMIDPTRSLGIASPRLEPNESGSRGMIGQPASFLLFVIPITPLGWGTVQNCCILQQFLNRVPFGRNDRQL